MLRPLLSVHGLSAFLLIASSSLYAQDGKERFAVPSSRSAYLLIEDRLGPGAAEILRSRNYVVTHGKKPRNRQVLHVQWRQLSALASGTSALLGFAKIYSLFQADGSWQGSPEGLRGVQELPVGGLVTPEVKAAAALLALHLKEDTALGAARQAAAGQRPLFLTPWGRAFARRYHADVLPDPGPLAGTFFRELLSGPDRDERAIAHFAGHLRAVYRLEGSGSLDRDRTRGAASGDLLGWVSRYLLDQRRLLTLARTREQLSALAPSLKRDLRDIKALAGPLSKAPKTLEELRSALSAAPTEPYRDGNATEPYGEGMPLPDAVGGGPPPNAVGARPHTRVRFLRGDLLLHSSPAGDLHDVGDTVVVSGAYWVEGLREGERVRVTEAGVSVHGVYSPCLARSAGNSGLTEGNPIRGGVPKSASALRLRSVLLRKTRALVFRWRYSGRSWSFQIRLRI